MNKSTRLPIKEATDKRSLYITTVIFLIIYIIASQRVGFGMFKYVYELPNVYFFITEELMPVSWHSYNTYLSALMDTFYIAIVSLVVASSISMILAFMASTTTMPVKAIRNVIKGGCAVLRNIPSLIMALMFVPAFGVGVTTGIMALTVGNIGKMTRFYVDTIEEINMEPVNSLEAMGMSRIQSLRFGAFPQALPGFISWTLYSLEVNIRSSAIIGMVGAGGVGMVISNNLSLFRYGRASMGIILIVLVVVAVEYISTKLRRRII